MEGERERKRERKRERHTQREGERERETDTQKERERERERGRKRERERERENGSTLKKTHLCCHFGNFSHEKFWSLFPKENQLRQSRATQPDLIPNL